MVKCKTSPEQKAPNLHQTQHFKRVRMRKWGKWISEVRMPNSRGRIWLGSYDSPHQAARAYDCAVYCLRGCKAKFNFPNSLPEIPSASSLSPPQIQSVAAKFALAEIPKTLDGAATPSGSELQSCIEGQQVFEEQDWSLLDLLLLQDIESSHCPNVEDFLPPDEAVEDIGLLFAEVKSESDLSPANDRKTMGFPNSH